MQTRFSLPRSHKNLTVARLANGQVEVRTEGQLTVGATVISRHATLASAIVARDEERARG